MFNVSYFCYYLNLIENERSKLDPLPELDPLPAITTTETSIAMTPSSNEPYKRVYPDWKPSTAIEKTDVRQEVFENAQPPLKEKVFHHQSNIGVDENSAKRDSLSSISLSSTTPLHSIIEEDRRVSSLTNDCTSTTRKVTRRQSEDYEPVYQKHTGISDSVSKYARPSISSAKSLISPSDEPLLTSNTIEIDSDNIETPPVVRKNLGSIDSKSASSSSSRKLQAPRPLHQRTIDEKASIIERDGIDDTNEKFAELEVLGDGNFDRHASARKTRRYRRPVEHSGIIEGRNDTSPELASPTSPINSSINSKYSNEAIIVDTSSVLKDTEIHNIEKEANVSVLDSKPTDILSRIGRQGRNMSTINQEAVREAIRKLKSPTETPERVWSPPREIIVTSKKRGIGGKTANHELNDEGFEETQSLVSESDTPSHTSFINEQVDTSHHNHTSRVKFPPNQSSSKPSVKTLLERNRQSLTRSRSLRASLVPTSQQPRNITIPKKTNSLRRNTDTGSVSKLDVERSGSRKSLHSSRSSINSATSINTVRNMGLKSPSNVPSTTNATAISTDKNLRKQLFSQISNAPRIKATQSKNGSSSNNSSNKSFYLRTPASRSSSSASSIGPSSRQPNSSRSSSVTPPTSISPTRPTFRNTVSISSYKSSSLTGQQVKPKSSANSNLTKGIKSSSRISSFMRPTTSSSNKKN